MDQRNNQEQVFDQPAVSVSTSKEDALLDILSLHYYPIQRRMLHYLDPASLLNLMKVSRRLRSLCSDHYKTLWNINKALSVFFKDPNGLRKLLVPREAFIDGHFAYDFLARNSNPDKELTIHAHRSQVKALRAFLVYEGYKIVKTQNFQGPDTTYAARYHYQLKHASGNVLTVLLRSTLEAPILALLQDKFPPAMNMIYCNEIVSLYPYLTFVERETFAMTSLSGYDLDQRFGEELEKYKSRGWTRDRCLSTGHDERLLEKLSGPRRFGDGKCWTMPLHPPVDQPEDSCAPQQSQEIFKFNMKRINPPFGDPGWAKYAKMCLDWWTMENPSHGQSLPAEADRRRDGFILG